MTIDKMTLLDIAKLIGTDGLVDLIDETIASCPEVRLISARPIKGTNFKTLVRISLPATGFRNANEGANVTKSVYENRLFQCMIFNPKWMIDKAVAMAHEDGPAALLALEAEAMLNGSFQTLGKQFYYGDASIGDSKGHPGLIDFYDSTNMVVDAAGTTADTGSSVWAVKHGPNYLQWLWGEDGDLGLTDPDEIQVSDGSTMYTAIHQEILSHVGLKLGSTKCLGRIKKLTADSGKGLTDSLIYDLLAKFPAGITPDVLLMSRRSLAQLRKSRTATNATGAPAPIPTEIEGIPIQVTDSILDTEPLTL